jgi:putative tricarboxylic transport membrane protein
MDLALMFAIGMAGYVMRLYDFPIAPVLIGLILGPMAEMQLRRALSISQGDPFTLVSTPISASLLAVSLIVLVLPAILRRISPKLAPT